MTPVIIPMPIAIPTMNPITNPAVKHVEVMWTYTDIKALL